MLTNNKQNHIKDYINQFKQKMINMILEKIESHKEESNRYFTMLTIVNNLSDDEIIAFALEAVSYDDNFFDLALTEIEKESNNNELPF